MGSLVSIGEINKELLLPVLNGIIFFITYTIFSKSAHSSYDLMLVPHPLISEFLQGLGSSLAIFLHLIYLKKNKDKKKKIEHKHSKYTLIYIDPRKKSKINIITFIILGILFLFTQLQIYMFLIIKIIINHYLLLA